MTQKRAGTCTFAIEDSSPRLAYMERKDMLKSCDIKRHDMETAIIHSNESNMNVGFIGIGKIASSIIKGLCTSNVKDIRINVSPRNEENSALLEKQFDAVSRRSSNQQVIDHSEIIFIALPPKIVKSELCRFSQAEEFAIAQKWHNRNKGVLLVKF